MEIISVGRLEYERWSYNTSSGRKFTVEFKVKAVELAKKLGRPVASLMVLILTWMKRNTRLELGNKWLMYYPY